MNRLPGAWMGKVYGFRHRRRAALTAATRRLEARPTLAASAGLAASPGPWRVSGGKLNTVGPLAIPIPDPQSPDRHKALARCGAEGIAMFVPDDRKAREPADQRGHGTKPGGVEIAIAAEKIGDANDGLASVRDATGADASSDVAAQENHSAVREQFRAKGAELVVFAAPGRRPLEQAGGVADGRPRDGRRRLRRARAAVDPLRLQQNAEARLRQVEASKAVLNRATGADIDPRQHIIGHRASRQRDRIGIVPGRPLRAGPGGPAELSRQPVDTADSVTPFGVIPGRLRAHRLILAHPAVMWKSS